MLTIATRVTRATIVVSPLFIPMDISQIEPYLRYITNASGDKTEVIFPVDVWNSVIRFLQQTDSGLDAIDEYESKDAIVSDLQDSFGCDSEDIKVIRSSK